MAPDEGHGFAGKENRLAMYAAMERFLARHLGGRHQEAMARPIADRLAAITVDVNKVVLKPAVATAPAGGVKQPVFAGESLRPATLKYSYKGQVMGRPIEGTSTLTVAAGRHADRAVWTISEVSKTSMGDAKDTTVVDGKTLLPVTRSMQQGPATIDVEFSDKEARGKMKAGPQEMPISAKLDGAVLVDGMPLNLAVGTLPLAPGYTTQLRSYDLMGNKVQIQKLEVKAAEEVTTPAGKFTALRVEIAPEDGAGGVLLWVEKGPPSRIVKWETTLSSNRGGGKISAELTDGGKEK